MADFPQVTLLIKIRLLIAVKLHFFKLPFTYYSVCAYSVSAVEGIGCWRITVGFVFSFQSCGS